MARFVTGIINGFMLLLTLELILTDDEVCDRRPLGTRTDPLPPDNRFKLEVQGLADKYIPLRRYTVHLFATDNSSTFIAFMISAREDTKANEKNSRKPTRLDPGRILPIPYETVPSPICNNSVIQLDITPKTSVTAHWQAPPKNNLCVTLYALLAVMQDVWYSYEGPLSHRVCEDNRKAEDMQPTENDNCDVEEDARYMLTFERLWSYNTHSLMYPTSEVAKFSDVVGASHSKNFNLFRLGSEASQGLKMLAEQGNTTELEIDIRKELGNSVRTIIKATSQAEPEMVSRSIFRASRDYHFVSIVAAIIPSPDWFLGAANMELCETETNRWATNLTLNLYPLDAGTDSGSTFDSPNEETLPAHPITRATINKSIPKDQTRPFARIRFHLIRTYSTPHTTGEGSENESKRYEESNELQPTTVSTTKETPPPLDPDSTAECPMTEWEDWMPCEGLCIDGQLQGYHTRIRYHLVDNVPVRKYDESGSIYESKEPSQYCLENYSESETQECTEPCEQQNEEVPAQRRTWSDPASSARGWWGGR